MGTEFSIVVPVYNAGPWLGPCVDSILGQTFRDFELILVDDGSTDGSGTLCDAYAQKDRRITVLHQPNQGVTAARRAGLRQVTGAYICFVDGDDLVSPRWLETVHAAAQANGRPDIVLFDLTMEEDWSSPGGLSAEPGYYDRARLEREIYPYMLWDARQPFFSQLLPGYLVIRACRRELFLAHYLQEGVRLTVFEDTATVYECMYAASSMVICPDVLYFYRQHDSSALHSYDPDRLQNVKTCREYLLSHLLVRAPELAGQVNAFAADATVKAILREFKYDPSARHAVRHVSGELKRTGLARELSFAGLPLRIQLYLLMLKCRLYYPAALVAQLRRRLYFRRHK